MVGVTYGRMKAKRFLGNFLSTGLLVWLILSSGCDKKTPTSPGNGGGGPTDNPTSITLSGADTLNVGDVYNGTAKTSDADGLDKMLISGTDGYDQSYDLSGTSATKTFQDTLKKGGSYTFDVLVTDANGNTTKKSISTYARKPNNTPSTATISPASVQNHTRNQFTASFHDVDGLKKAIIDGLLNKTYTLNGTNASKQFSDSIAVSGTLPQSKGGTISVIDSKNDTTKIPYSIDITATPQSTYALSIAIKNALTNTGVDSTIVALKNGTKTLDHATTDAQGNVTLHVTQDQGASENYTLDAQRSGYNDDSQTISVSKDENITTKITPEDLQWVGQLQSVAYRDSELVDLGTLVKTATGWIKSVGISGESSGLAVRHEKGNQYWLVGEQSGAQYIMVTATSGADRSGQHQFGMSVGQPADITFNTKNLETLEGNGVTINTKDLVSSPAGIDTAWVSMAQDWVKHVGTGQWEITPTTSGTYTYTTHATDGQGVTKTTNNTLLVDKAPTYRLVVESSETDKPDHAAWLVTLNKDGTVRDSVVSSTGIFTGKFHTPDSTEVRVGLFKNGAVWSFEREQAVFHGNKDVVAGRTYFAEGRRIPMDTLKVIDYGLRDSTGVLVGELQEGASGAKSPEGYKRMIYESHATQVFQGWNGTSPVPARATWNHWTTSKNGMGPDEVIMPDTVIEKGLDGKTYTFYLPAITKQRVSGKYNILKQHMGQFKKNITYTNKTTIDFFHQDRNIAYLLPDGALAQYGYSGASNVYGESPSTILSVNAEFVTPDPGNQTGTELAAWQEPFNVLGYNSTVNNDNWTDHQGSIIRDTYYPMTPQPVDWKSIDNVWESNFSNRVGKVVHDSNFSRDGPFLNYFIIVK